MKKLALVFIVLASLGSTPARAQEANVIAALEAAGVKTVRSPAELGDAVAEVTGW